MVILKLKIYDTLHFSILKVQVHVEDDPARIFKATEVGTNITFVINVIFV